jgi:hypothetical protein
VGSLDDGGTSDGGTTGGDATLPPNEGGSPDAPGADAGVDAPPPSDAAREVGSEGCNGRPPIPPGLMQPAPMACGYRDSGANFPLFNKCCAAVTDCVMATYQFRCCGDTYTFGLNKADFAAVDQARVGWECAACGCASGGNHTEDGLTASFPTVACDNGYCMTHGQQ